MKNFNVKQPGSEVILEEVKEITGITYTEWLKFTPLILTSIDPNIKVGEVIREDQLEPDQWQYKDKKSGEWNGFDNEGTDPEGLSPLDNLIGCHYTVRQVAKLKQPVHETPKSDHDLETCTEKEEKVIGETPIQEEETEINKMNNRKLLSDITDDHAIEVAKICFDEVGYTYRFTKVDNRENVHQDILSIQIELYIIHPEIMEWAVLGHVQIDTEEFDINFLRKEGEDWFDDVIDSLRIVKAYQYLSKFYQLDSVQEHKPESEENLNTLELGIEIVAAMKASLWDWDIESGRMDALSDTEIDRLSDLDMPFEEYSPEDKEMLTNVAIKEKERLHKQAEFAAKCTLDWFKKQGFEITKKI